MILFAPVEKMLWAAGLCFLAAGIFYPVALLRIFRPRWLLLLGMLTLIMAVTGKPDAVFWNIPFSSTRLAAGLQMALRAVVIFIAVDGLSSSLDISVLAGLLERAGLRGLGFSIGVAMNLLPGLRQSVANTWRSLWMRGGLRRQRWRSLRLLLTTVMTNALRQAEEIALAAEARAYTPDRSRTLPLTRGVWDGIILAVLGVTLLLVFIYNLKLS